MPLPRPWWTRIPLAAKTVRVSVRVRNQVTGRGKSLVTRVRYLWPTRGAAAVSRRLRSIHGKAAPLIVTAATCEFPQAYLTFVCQEITGFQELLGARVCHFHWLPGDWSQLHDAYRHLRRSTLRLPFCWHIQRADMTHFRRRRPARFASLLDRLAGETGRTVDDLLVDPLIQHAFTFARRVEDVGARYVHTYFFYEQSLFALVAAWLLDLPRGLSAYADHMLDDFPFKLVRLHLETADVVVATSQRIRDELIALSGPEFAAKIVVKPNGPDGSRFTPMAHAHVPGSPFELLSVSRIEEKKGLLTLVEAVRLLRDRGRAVRVHVVGTADSACHGSVEYEAAFGHRIDQLGVGDAIVRHGFMRHESLRPLLQRSHAFVAPYEETARGDKDGIPTSVLEAMASALPILCTDSGSIPEAVTDGVEGLCFGQRDAAGLADAVERLIDDPGLCAALGAAAHRRFADEFDYRRVEARLHERIRGVLAARSAARAPASANGAVH